MYVFGLLHAAIMLLLMVFERYPCDYFIFGPWGEEDKQSIKKNMKGN
jgi:hypothetical protein